MILASRTPRHFSECRERHLAPLAALLLLIGAILAPARSIAADISPVYSQSKNALGIASRCQDVPAGAAKRKDGDVLLSADTLTYDVAKDSAVADGHVEAAFFSCVLTADHVEYDAKNNVVRANGNIAILEPSGNVVFANSLELSGGLEQGLVLGFSAVLGDGKARIAAHGAKRKQGEITELDHVVYSPCQVCNKPGFEPLWQIKALRVIHNEKHKVIIYKSAVMEVKGVPVFYLPYFEHSDPSVKRASGFLIPAFGNSTDLGNNIEVPYFINFGPNRDMTLSPMITTEAGTDLKVEYRERTKAGQMTLDGSFVYANINPNTPGIPPHETWRSHLFGSGQFRFNDEWTYGFNTQLTSDDTYLRRYEISDLDRLTTRIYAEGISDRNYASLNSYYFQGLRQQDRPETTPLILPLGDLTWYPQVHWLGGTVRVDGDMLSLTRTEGGNSHRVSLAGSWQRQAISNNGNVFTMFAQSRGDVYYTDNNNPTHDPLLPADSQTIGRAIPTIGFEWRYPLVRPSASFYQVVEPIVQAIWSPYGGNPKNIPNEDSTDFEFDDSNLFTLNKLPGYDLVETGPRANVGLRYAIFGPSNQELEIMLGQNFRLKDDPIFDSATGFGSRQSDYVGRIHLQANRYLELIHRFRVDRHSFHFNRNEFIVRAGLNDYWGRISYVQLAQDPAVPGLPRREEIEGQTHLKIWGNWSFEGEGRRDIENNQMITSGAALVYSNDCIEIQFAYRRRFTEDREIRPSSSFNIRIRLKTFGETSGHGSNTTDEGVVSGGYSGSEILGEPAHGGIFGRPAGL
ncbi:MAG: LPS assembly protein LptD [Alphaproteobacteria bacterium]